MTDQPSCLRRLGFAFLVLAFVLALSSTAAAQSSTTGALQGTVKDPKGLGVPNITVHIANTGTGEGQDKKADDTGVFRVENLPPGTYRVSAEVPGFNKYESPNIIVEVGRVTNIDVPLAIAGATATVTVTEKVPLVNTTQQDFSSNVNSQFMANLPMNGTRWSNFALLTPGITPDGGFGLLSFRGISGLLNNNEVDGGNNNQAFFSEEVGRTRLNYSTSPVAVREFQVNTSNYSAEYGRAAGGVVNAVTKSGTNQFHGDGYYFIRDQALGATNPYSFCSGVLCKPPDRRQTWGGDIGGPIVKDKLFFFFNFDQVRRNFPSTATTSFPNSLTLSAADQTSVTAAGVTAAQQTQGLAFIQSLTGIVPRQGNQYIIFPKGDWYITPNEHFVFSYNKLVWNSPEGIQTAPVVNRGTHSYGNDFVRSYYFNTHLYSTFGPSVTNDAFVLYGVDDEFETSQTPATGEPLTAPNGTTPDVFVNNVLEWGKPTFLDRRAYPNESRYELADTVSVMHGKHLWKFGADFSHVNDIYDNLFEEAGTYSYSKLADWLIDYAFSLPGTTSTESNCSTKPPAGRPCYSSFTQGVGPTKFILDTLDMAFFAQDDFRVRSNFTINLGLRYEYEMLPSPQIPNPLLPLTNIFPHVRNNWGPRGGFAWDISGNGKTSLRGGAGAYYGRIINSTIANGIVNTGVAAGQLTFPIRPSTDPAFVGPFYPCTFVAAAAVNPLCTGVVVGGAVKTSAVEFGGTYKNPLIYEGDLSLERDLGWNTVLSASWLLTLGRRLPTFIDTNLNAPTTTATYSLVGGPLAGQMVTMPKYTGARPNANFNSITDIDSFISSNYNALAVRLQHRYSSNLEFLVSYTYSHALDDGEGSQTFTATNSPLLSPLVSPDKGNSNFDLRHRVSTIIVWTPMYFKDHAVAHAFLDNWVVTPILTFSSGFAYSPTTSGSLPGTTAGGINGSGGSSRFPFFLRNSFNAPVVKDVDMRLSRHIPIHEKINAELTVEAFNLFNHTQVTSVNTRMYIISGTTMTFDPTFGRATTAGNTLINSRQIQFGVLVHF